MNIKPKSGLPNRPYAAKRRPEEAKPSPPDVKAAAQAASPKAPPEPMVEITIAPRHTLQSGRKTFGPGDKVMVTKTDAREYRKSGLAIDPKKPALQAQAPKGFGIHNLDESGLKIGLISTQMQ